jgi:spore germination cell wall hydrolase CwlJ-like protein
MRSSRSLRRILAGISLLSLAGLAGCGGSYIPSARNDRNCLARAMYFESIRSSDEGMLAVGTVVMNRLESGKYPNTVCGVVGQKNQFAPGVLSKRMQEGTSRQRAERIAQAVLNGKRHRGVGKAMFFHTAGRTYRYSNMHYVLVAGGNAFYERKPTGRRYIPRNVITQAGPRDSISPGFFGSTYVAAAEEPARPAAARVEPVAVAAAPPPPQLTIEQLILADAGF